MLISIEMTQWESLLFLLRNEHAPAIVSIDKNEVNQICQQQTRSNTNLIHTDQPTSLFLLNRKLQQLIYYITFYTNSYNLTLHHPHLPPRHSNSFTSQPHSTSPHVSTSHHLTSRHPTEPHVNLTAPHFTPLYLTISHSPNSTSPHLIPHTLTLTLLNLTTPHFTPHSISPDSHSPNSTLTIPQSTSSHLSTPHNLTLTSLHLTSPHTLLHFTSPLP
jgi:hypothetical protein